MFIPEIQRVRLLDAAQLTIAQVGYRNMTVKRVTGRAKMSGRTFYDLFADREDCFLAVFSRAIDELARITGPAYASEDAWASRVRAGLGSLLEYVDADPGLADLVFVQALGVGPRVLERRAQVLRALAGIVDEGRGEQAGTKRSRQQQPPPLTGESVVGAVFSVIHTRLSIEGAGSLSDLLNPLMATIVLPYEGPAAAQRELNHRRRKRPVARTTTSRVSKSNARDPLEGLKMRLTVRTLRVLTVIAEQPGASNRTVGEAAGIGDQGQISKLLQRLEGLSLAVNTTPANRYRPTGEPNAWYLTPRGEDVQQITQIGSPEPDHQDGES